MKVKEFYLNQAEELASDIISELFMYHYPAYTLEEFTEERHNIIDALLFQDNNELDNIIEFLETIEQEDMARKVAQYKA